jgi:hypothetical protein
MIIPDGEYVFPDRALKFDLAGTLDVSGERTCYMVTGGNGYGKTTFIEKVVIAAMQQEGLRFLYLGQDIRTQLYTLRALLSVQGVRVSGVDDTRLLEMWIDQSRSAGVFLLDEYDKYLPDFSFIFGRCDAFIRTYFIVSHRDPEHIRPDPARYRLRRLRFELASLDDVLKNIRIHVEDPWPP